MKIEKHIDELNKEEFNFWINGNSIILNSYFLFSCENIRKRKYNIVKKYSRISERDSNITLEEVPFTQEIREEALSEYVKTLRVVTWTEYKNN